MDDCQRRQIEAMRKKGMGYKAIARKTKLSRDSVRNYCRWHHLNGYGAAVAAAFRKETVYEII
jgi:DNA-binding CsgD family transcriptional regulator